MTAHSIVLALSMIINTKYPTQTASKKGHELVELHWYWNVSIYKCHLFVPAHNPLPTLVA